MKKFTDARKIYESIEIPEELPSIVEKTIEQYKKTGNEKKISKYMNFALISAAAIFLSFTVALNVSYTFAKSIENIPILGAAAKILTVRTYDEKDKDKTIAVKVPAIANKEKASNKAINDINEEIDKKIEQYVKRANKNIEEYKKAFLETGGTKQEWAEHNIHVDVNYEIKMQTEDYVSFVITGYENWSNAYLDTYFYNIDLNTGKKLTLRQILGKDFINIVNESIQKQMEERVKKDKDVTYFSREEGGFDSINKDTNFYINKKGNPVIVFNKYEIAPGFMGQQEFEIDKK